MKLLIATPVLDSNIGRHGAIRDRILDNAGREEMT